MNIQFTTPFVTRAYDYHEFEDHVSVFLQAAGVRLDYVEFQSGGKYGAVFYADGERKIAEKIALQKEGALPSNG